MGLSTSNRIAVLRGTADATFRPVTHLTLPFVTSATPHDVNADGHVDLFLLESNSAQTRALVALGNGDGTFQTAAPVFPRDQHGAPRFHDLVGDGSVDLIAPRAIFNDLVVYAGDGRGGFSLALTLVPTGTLGASVLGDFDGNGRLDVAVVTESNGIFQMLQIAWGRSSGGFDAFVRHDLSTLLGQIAERPRELQVGDVDHDGAEDLLIVGTRAAHLLLGSADRTPVFHERFTAGARTSGGALVDLDDDAHLDLVLTNGEDALLTIRYGAGDGSFSAAREYTVGATGGPVRAGDVDADGDVDLVLSSGHVTLVENQGGREFEAAPVLRRGAVPGAVRLADLDHDGSLDLVSADDSRVHVSLGEGNGRFQPGTPYEIGEELREIAAVHWNDDTHVDLAFTTAENHLGVLVGDGSGAFEAPESLVASGPRLAVGDVSGDARSEIVTASFRSLYVHERDAAGGWTRRTAYDGGLSFSHLALHDMDGDENVDVLLSGYETTDVTLLFGAGDGSFTSNGTVETTSGVVQTLAEDFSGDCRPDLLVNQSAAIDSLLYFPAIANGGFGPSSILPSNYGTAMESADLDRDGWLDAVLVHFGISGCQVELNRGAGNFTRRVFGCSSVSRLAIGDLDGDARPDLVLSHDTPGYLSVVLNRSRR